MDILWQYFEKYPREQVCSNTHTQSYLSDSKRSDEHKTLKDNHQWRSGEEAYSSQNIYSHCSIPKHTYNVDVDLKRAWNYEENLGFLHYQHRGVLSGSADKGYIMKFNCSPTLGCGSCVAGHRTRKLHFLHVSKPPASWFVKPGSVVLTFLGSLLGI